MNKRSTMFLTVAVALLALSGAVWAQLEELGTPATRAKIRRAGGKVATVGVDQAAMEAYLKERLARNVAAHKIQHEFMSKESEVWESFWDQARSDRSLFEVRMARQRLDLFESLASLRTKDYAGAINDFEKLHNNVTQSYENQLRQKMKDFFAEREAQWKAFAIAQEKARVDYVADGESGWQTQKTTVLNSASTSSKKAK